MMKQTALPKDNAISFADSANIDAFSRIRVSNPQTLFESQAQYGFDQLRMDQGATGAGVAPAWSSNTRLVTLQVNAGGGGGTSFLQSFNYLPYQPGKSQCIYITGVMGSGTAGAVKRYGYGDANNGIFYEQNGVGGVQFNRRTSTSGGVVENAVTQANWNEDKFDGTGPSGVVLDPTKAFILVIDLQFLGMGRVRVGFDINGIIFYAHHFEFANVITVPYMQTASLPVMAEIIAAAALGGVATCSFKCSTVTSEGGYQFGLGREFSAEGTVTAASGARTHILSIRPKTTFNALTNRVLIIPAALEVIGGANPVLWELCIGVNFGATPPTWANVNATYSAVEFGINGTFVDLNAGIVIAAGYISSNTPASRSVAASEITTSYPITLDRAGAQRNLGTLSLLLTGLGGTSASRSTLNWFELR